MAVPATTAPRRISHEVVQEAIRTIGKLKLKPQADSMLRVLLGFSALRKSKPSSYETDSADLRVVVQRIFQVLDGPKEFPGTLTLRGSGGLPSWLTNDSYRGSWQDYAGPNGGGRRLFEDDDYRKPLRSDAVSRVAAVRGRADTWPPRDALAAIVLRDQALDPALNWNDLIDLARDEFGLSPTDWNSITSTPALAALEPFDGPEWDPSNLSSDLRPASGSTVAQTETTLDSLADEVKTAVSRVIDALRRHGQSKIVALAGVPGTSKTFVGRIAARAFASPGCLLEIQFSPGYTYEEFIEGPRFTGAGNVETVDGLFRDFNKRALDHPDQQFVLLIEELSRADIPKVFGELLTFVEYRGVDDEFTTMYRRNETTRVAPNLAILATYNPTDRSAVTIDGAILRRLRVLSFPPSTLLLREMLANNGVDDLVIAALVDLFEACRNAATPERFEEAMPFGHAVFHEVESEEDLYDLWWQELRPILIRPRTPQHELYETIRERYPWAADPDFRLPKNAATPEASVDDSAAGAAT